MSSRRSQPGLRGSKRSAGIEWIGGIVALPAYVTGEGQPYRPEALFWMGADAAILGTKMAEPGQVLPMASESLQSTIEQPMYGRPHRPARVRVASAELADALRAGHPELDVVCAPTPELDAMLAAMRKKIGADGPKERSHLSREITAEAMASFFEATAALFRAQPWKLMDGDDQSLFAVTIDQLGVHDKVMSVIGHMGQRMGLLLFSSLDDYDAFLDAADPSERRKDTDLPPHFALTFARGADLAPALRKEISDHGWEVAGPNAYPSLMAVDEDLIARPLASQEVTMVEAISRALTQLAADEEALRDVWDSGDPISRTLSVTTHRGQIDVALYAPHVTESIVIDSLHGLVSDLAELVENGEDVDPERRHILEDELVRRFTFSPEAKELHAVYACRLVMDLAVGHIGCTIATLEASDLREVLFDLVPRKVSIDASEAPGIIDEMRAFYTFLKRELDLQQADACLEVLGDDAAKELEAALSDSSNFSMAKSLVMKGRGEGFDMKSKGGLEAWMQAARGKMLHSSTPLPTAPQPRPKKDAKAKKDKRKAARKARKKNR